MSKLAALAPIFTAASAVSSVVGLLKKSPKPPNIPTPAPPAPVTRTNTGANVAIGTSNVKNQRVSGRSFAGSSSVGNLLGGLGRGGLSI